MNQNYLTPDMIDVTHLLLFLYLEFASESESMTISVDRSDSLFIFVRSRRTVELRRSNDVGYLYLILSSFPFTSTLTARKVAFSMC